jgi:hypothetical protein
MDGIRTTLYPARKASSVFWLLNTQSENVVCSRRMLLLTETGGDPVIHSAKDKTLQTLNISKPVLHTMLRYENPNVLPSVMQSQNSSRTFANYSRIQFANAVRLFSRFIIYFANSSVRELIREHKFANHCEYFRNKWK